MSFKVRTGQYIEQRERAEELDAALRVLVLRPETQAWLRENDPKALEQAFAALGEEVPDPLTPCCSAYTTYVEGGLVCKGCMEPMPVGVYA